MSSFPSLNFAWLAKLSTGRKPILKGLLPPVGTILTLLASALAISGFWWLWAGASVTMAAFLPFYAKTFFAVCGLTVLNFLFSREIHTFMYSTREVRDNFVFDKENPTDLRRLVNHVRIELNAYFKKIYGNKHVDIPMPRLLTFYDPHFEIVTVDGMSPWHSAILFSSGVFNSHETGLNQRDLAALIQHHMVKSYLNRGASSIIVRMGVELLSTLESFHKANWFTKLLGAATWPLEFLFLAEKSVNRSYEYEADTHVAKMGRGMDLLTALDTKVCPSLYKRPTTKQLSDDKANKVRPPYQGPLKWLFGPMVEWIRTNLEMPEDHKESNILWTAVCGLVRELGFHINELRSMNARSTRRKDHLRLYVDEGNAQTKNDVQALYKKDKAKNQALYDQVPAAHRYEIIGPKGNGKGHWDKEQEQVVPYNKNMHKRKSTCSHIHASAPILHQHALHDDAVDQTRTAVNDADVGPTKRAARKRTA